MPTPPTTSAPPRAQPSSGHVSTKPGGVGFTIGRGGGQWALLGAVAVVTGATVWQGARLGCLCLVVVLVVGAVARATLPARWVPALVNRGRVFDVSVFVILAALVSALVVSGARL